jgi:four helix bundle protein
MALQTYRNLDVWKKSMDLVEEIYRLAKIFPQDELFGLTSQIRRATVSVPANIAEGYGRLHRKEYINHLSIARGSLMEVETHLQIAVRLGYLDREQALAAWILLQDVGKMLSRLIRSLSNTTTSAARPKPETQNPEPEG